MKIRYGITCMTARGDRTIATTAQARHLWDNKEDACKWLEAMLSARDNEQRLRQIHGAQAIGTFEVSKFACWDNGDPKGIFPIEEQDGASDGSGGDGG